MIFCIDQPDSRKRDRVQTHMVPKSVQQSEQVSEFLSRRGGQPVSDELHVSAPLARAAQRAVETLEVQPFSKRVLPGLAIEALVLGRPRSYCVPAGENSLELCRVEMGG